MNMGLHKGETCYNFLDLKKSHSPDKSKAFHYLYPIHILFYLFLYLSQYEEFSFLK